MFVLLSFYRLPYKKMAEILFFKVLDEEIEINSFFEWLFQVNPKEHNFEGICDSHCSQLEFINYFLNYIHEDVLRACEKNVRSKESQKENDSELLEMSSCFDALNLTTSTPTHPKTTKKIISRSSEKSSPLVLGDFIVGSKRSPNQNKNKKSLNRSLDFGVPINKRRINPTNLTATIENSWNSFDFGNPFKIREISVKDVTDQRQMLAKERLTIIDKITDSNGAVKNAKLTKKPQDIEPEIDCVRNPDKIDKTVRIYSELVVSKSFVLNVTSEINFLIVLMLKNLEGATTTAISSRNDNRQLFGTIHDIVYFAVKSLGCLIDILTDFDKSTLKLLASNCRLVRFSPKFSEILTELSTVKKERLTFDMKADNTGNVFYDCDTDNRRNFPNDRSFHAFRKQRDQFYEILRIWEMNHLNENWDYVLNLESRIKNLLNLSREPSNYFHFARLFKSQILNTCRYHDHNNVGSGGKRDIDDRSLVSSLSVNQDKLNKLRSRLVTKQITNGINAPPTFTGLQEFYKEFIAVGCDHNFNCHLIDSLISELIDLNNVDFINDNDGVVVDVGSKTSFFVRVKSLKLLGKFLGFLQCLPYKSGGNILPSDHLTEMYLTVRNKQSRPLFNIQHLLDEALINKSVILCVPWLTDYLSMLDSVTLRLPYYLSLVNCLFGIYREFDSRHLSNTNLIRFCLGWLFDLPHFPKTNRKLRHNGNKQSDISSVPSLDHLCVVDQNVIYYCCPYLDEIKKVLMENHVSSWVPMRHITPISSIRQSPEEVASKKLQKELEEAFFKSHPASLKRTVDFVSERVTSACVKHLYGNVLPHHKSVMVEELTVWITSNEDECLEDDLPPHPITKVDQVVADSLMTLHESCRHAVDDLCTKRIKMAVDALVSDVLPQTKEVCVKLATKYCLERVNCWINEHVTSATLSKECLDELKRVFGSSCRKKNDDMETKPIFVLPPGGKNPDHNDETKSAADLMEEIRDLSVEVVEGRAVVTVTSLGQLLDDISKSDSERGDINQCVMATICRSLEELSLLLLAHYPSLLTDHIVDRLVAIWDLYYGDTDDLLKSLLCPRTVIIFRQSGDAATTWKAFAKFCVYLIGKGALGMENFEGQCTAIFRTDWDEESLRLITDFYKVFIDLYKGGDSCHDNFPALLDFFSNYCEDL